jgi:small GTP-binding protein
MLGTFAVGKTSLVRQFVYSQFTDDYLSTLGVQMSNKTVKVDVPGSDKQRDINLILWDLSHVEKFDAVVKTHLHGSHAAIVVFDLTRPQSFSEYETMINGFMDINPDSTIVLAGNKSDLSEDKEPRQQIHEIASQLNCPVFYTSAKTADNVDALFQSVAEHLS